MMYLFITEDGEIVKSKTFTDDDLQMCNDGMMELLDISNPELPMSYYKGWNDIEEVVYPGKN